MNKVVFTLTLLLCFTAAAVAQTIFTEEIDLPESFVPERVIMPPSPLTLQVLFVGGDDIVETTRTYGNPAGHAVAKEWNDFIGFTPDNTGESMGWISVNHEMVYRDDRIGDGGGMTVFRVERDDITGLLHPVYQKLDDGREGKFFNVDFVNTVGETGMNCGGISSNFDGRIWTAEEWFRNNTESIYDNNNGVRDTAAFTISSDLKGWDGVTIDKYQNFNYMVEIDPKQAKAIRKQYNWGRLGWEGGVIANDNRTVYLGPDATPGFFMKFVAGKPGDFTTGKLYAYKHDAPDNNCWVLIDDGDDVETLLNLHDACVAAGATMYNRPEWVAHDPSTDLIYWTETGLDFPSGAWSDDEAMGAVHDPAHIARAQAQGLTSPSDPQYRDTYGRIWVYNPFTHKNYVLLEGGPDWDSSTSPSPADYFKKHLANPDGLNVMKIDGQSFLVICEDLNGSSWGRMPAGISNRTCELYLLNLAIENPTTEDLIRISAVPAGAEVTGVIATPDGKSLLVNSQHPSSNNPYPWNHSLTYAIHGFDRVKLEEMEDNNPFQPDLPTTATNKKETNFTIYPNPTARVLFLNQVTDIAIYDVRGQRVKVMRNTNEVDVSDLAAGMYFVQNANRDIVQLTIQ
jgi:hypothetical protein